MRSQAVGDIAGPGARRMAAVAGDLLERAVDAAVANPLVAVAVAVAVGVALVGLGALVWWLRRTPADRFVKVLSEVEAVTVLMHPGPDPDAMASALAVRELAGAVDTDTAVQYAGAIRHPENRAFETVLECEFDRIDHVEDIDAKAVVLVDHNEPRGFEGADTIEPYAVVDHHPGAGEGSAFTDVRTDRGSCASILTDYLRDQGWRTDGDGRRLSSRLATGLLYGIHSDTTAFTEGCTHAEFDAAAFLFPRADSDNLERIASPQLDGETLRVKAKAIDAKRIEGPFLFSHVGRVSNRDSLPIAADELVRLEGVTAAVISGELDGTLHVTGRSRDDRVHMGKAMETALEGVPGGNGGGHPRKAAGQIALPESAAGREDHPEVEERLLAAMRGEL